MMAYKFTVKELIEIFRDEPENAIVYAIFHDEADNFNERPIYKTATSADEKELYLYLGNNRQ